MPIASTNTVLLVSQLNKSFGKKPILQDFNVCIHPGESIGIVGPNGIGKSTLVRCLTGLMIPDSGKVIIAGHHLTTEPVKVRSALRVLPQEIVIPKGLTGRELLEFYASTFTAPASIDRLISLTGLGSQIDHLATTYSFGQQRRLIFAGLCAGFGQLFVLDEPFAGLDQEAQQCISNELKTRLQQGAGALITAHHNLDKAITELCSQTLPINS